MHTLSALSCTSLMVVCKAESSIQDRTTVCGRIWQHKQLIQQQQDNEWIFIFGLYCTVHISRLKSLEIKKHQLHYSVAFFNGFLITQLLLYSDLDS